jgi:hypothetical protein
MLSSEAVVVSTNSAGYHYQQYQQDYMGIGINPINPISNSTASNITPMRRGRPVRQTQTPMVTSSSFPGSATLEQAFSNNFDPFNDMQ